MRRRRAVTVLCGFLTFCAACSHETQTLLEPGQALAIVLAEETARFAGSKKQVAIISPDSTWGPVSIVEEAFKKALKKRGFTPVDAKAASLGDPMRSGAVGLKGADFTETIQKFSAAGAVVSFAGAPLLGLGETGTAEQAHPPVLVVATAMLGNVPGVPGDRNQLDRLLKANLIQLAVIDGAAPLPHPPTKADSTHDLFAQHFQILLAR